MFLSISNFTFNPEKYDELMAIGESVVAEASQIQGCKGMLTYRTGENTSTAIATYVSREAAEAATPQVQKIFAGMAEYLTAPPVRNIYETAIYEQF